MPAQTLNTSTSTTLAAQTLVAMTCEYIVGARYRDLYDLYDEQSLDAFHGWLGKRISDALLQKYGRCALDAIPYSEIWLDDLGLIADCDFEDLPDGSMRVTFSRVTCQQSAIGSNAGGTQLHSSKLGVHIWREGAYA
ncbi:hypothetical protein ACO0K7_09190 [Undibacterium sp. Ji67W]|uniref:hypothetical protein n=1 Tax=Undibacterium sp. Ji67W TaxID=3413042 RepID=UPI003BEFE85C